MSNSNIQCLPLERVKDRSMRVQGPDHQLSQNHRASAGKKSQQMWIEKVMRWRIASGALPDEQPDEAVEGEVDDETDVRQTQQRSLRVVDSGRFLINLTRRVLNLLGDNTYFTFSSEPPL